MPALFTHWAICSLLLLTLSLSLGTARADELASNASLILHHPDGDVDALVLDADIDLQVQGLLADMTLEQTFRNTTDQWLEGSYLFPLPPDATVRGLKMVVGERTIIAEIQPREEAKIAYKAASDAGQVASLVEQQRPNLFTMNLANIGPGESIKVTMDIMLPVNVTEQQLQLRLPTTLTPRFTNAATPDAQSVVSSFTQPEYTRGPRLNVSLTIAPLTDYASVSSATHTLEASDKGLQISDAPMDQDLIIEWPAQYAQDTSVHAFVASHDNERYVQLLVNPPASIDDETPTPRELIVIVDKSGSMAGVSMRAAKEALHYAIDGLTDDDYLNIVAFDDRHYPMFTASRQVDQNVKKDARRFTDNLTADGGTEMLSALSFALSADTDVDADAQRLRQIVFVTDGSVGYEEELLKHIKNQLGNSRLFTVGIGPSPNTWFLEKAAEAGRGVSVSILDEHDVASAITDLLNGLVNPVITDIAVQYPNGHGEIYPRPLPDLYAERPGMWVAKISAEVDQLVITGKHHGERWRQTVQLPATATDTDTQKDRVLQASAPAIAMQWTRRKIDTLMDEQRYSADKELNKHLITQLAMKAGLVTDYTSFVAIEEQPIRPIEEQLTQQQVANLIPKGNSMMNIALPQGSAGADTLRWISLLLGLTALSLFGLARTRNQ
ncbi:VIT domain-containing protein [Granulosicoccus antarcticus]|nr:VIT domain-containing protein [Granulosicoccus antarcticus]